MCLFMVRGCFQFLLFKRDDFSDNLNDPDVTAKDLKLIIPIMISTLKHNN